MTSIFEALITEKEQLKVYLSQPVTQVKHQNIEGGSIKKNWKTAYCNFILQRINCN